MHTCCCCCCCLHIKSSSDLYSVLSNIRTGPTDANAFRGHRLTTQKGYTHRKEIKGPRKVNTHAIIGKEKKTPQKKKAQDSQTSQATCQTKEIDRAHRSHSTREAKQNETNKKNQGSPIKTIKSHDSVLVPLLGRGVFTAGFAPPRPFPTSSNYYSVIIKERAVQQIYRGFLPCYLFSVHIFCNSLCILHLKL